MAVLFDSGPRARPDQDEELAGLLASAGTPIAVSHHDGRFSRTIVDRWRMGSHDLFRARGDGLVLSRSSAHVQSDAPEVMRLGYQQGGRYTLVAGDQAEQGGHGRVNITDLTQPCVFTQAGTNAAAASFEISFAQLEIRPDVIRRARTQLLHSPVYTLLHGHMARLSEGVGDVELTDTGPFVGDATVLLTRAAIASVGDTSTRRRNAMKEVLYERVVEYIVQHLRDPAMTPERIAAAHNISLRHLYRLWAHNEVGIAEWIMRERFAGAARDLRDAAQNAVPVAAIARGASAIRRTSAADSGTLTPHHHALGGTTYEPAPPDEPLDEADGGRATLLGKQNARRRAASTLLRPMACGQPIRSA